MRLTRTALQANIAHMNIITENFELIAKGGIVMIPIFALSFYTFYVVVLKILQFKSVNILRGNSDDLIEKNIAQIRDGNWQEAEKNLQAEATPLAKVMLSALQLIQYKTLPQKRIEPEIERVGMAELNKLKTHLRGLEVTAAIAPLLGLLGTVIGMVKAFAKLAENTTRIDPSVLAGGIWEALITTIAGLLVAIPAFFAYYYFHGKIEKLRMQMKDSATQILNLQAEEEKAKPQALPLDIIGAEIGQIAGRVDQIERDIYQQEQHGRTDEEAI